MRVSFGIITKYFNTLEPIDEFLRNALKFKHPIYSVIIVYSHSCDFRLVESLKKTIKVFVVQINKAEQLKEQLVRMGVSLEALNILHNCPSLRRHGIVPYGLNRNYVMMEALLNGSEILIFVDTDVYPKVLIKENNKTKEKEIDFVGRHLEYLKKEEVIITTSDYSGYYIIPHMEFNGMKELFIGLQKEDAYEFLKEAGEHKCLVLDNYKNRKVFETDKILGGNVAIKLSALKELPPFFSVVYNIDGERVLSRGEDTLLGIKLKEINKKCIDIDTRIFHNTFGNYPEVPDIKHQKSVRDKFYYSCLGWIGRNPFLNWLKGENLEEVKERQNENITIGSKAISEYLTDRRFLVLPKALEISYNRIEQVIEDYRLTLKAWEEFVYKIEGRKV